MKLLWLLAVVVVVMGIILAIHLTSSEGPADQSSVLPKSPLPVSSSSAQLLQSRIAFTSGLDNSMQIYTMDIDGGNQLKLTNDPSEYNYPSWSPDGKKIVFATRRTGNWQLYTMNADGSGKMRLTNDKNNDEFPAWSIDGKKIAFISDQDGYHQIYVINGDGSNQIKITSDQYGHSFPTWSPDGIKIAFVSSIAGDLQVYYVDTTGGNQIRLTGGSTAKNNNYPAWSPDGKRIAFSSNRDGNWQIYIMNPDGSKQMRVTSDSSNCNFPAWSLDGKKIAFVSDRDGTHQIYNMDANGSNQVRLTNDKANDDFPKWSPSVNPVATNTTGSSAPVQQASSPTVSKTYPSYLTYKNVAHGYSIDYPASWNAKDGNNGPIIVCASPFGLTTVISYDNEDIPMARYADGFLESYAKFREHYNLLDSRKMDGTWDWYLDFTCNDTKSNMTMNLRSQAYFKKTPSNVYVIFNVGQKDIYDSYPFQQIVNSFTLY
jgi:dipeptidyl aminopeptidase/acylaminoacyl peptidase